MSNASRAACGCARVWRVAVGHAALNMQNADYGGGPSRCGSRESRSTAATVAGDVAGVDRGEYLAFAYHSALSSLSSQPLARGGRQQFTGPSNPNTPRMERCDGLDGFGPVR
jgi:hypothetical protein